RVRVAVFLVGAEYRDTELFAGTRIEWPDNDLLILLIGLDVALARVRSDVQLQDVTLHARRFRCRRIASRTEIEQMELQDREFESVGEEEQVYLDERLDERVEAAGHPEQAYGVAELAPDVLEAHLPVGCGIVEEEVDRERQARLDAGLDDL